MKENIMAWFQVRPLNFYKRDREVFKRIASGALTSQDVLAIEFGEFPMRGLDITHMNNRPVQVRHYFQDKNTRLWRKLFFSSITLGYVHGKPISAVDDGIKTLGEAEAQRHDRAIYLNKLFFSPLAQILIGVGFHLPLIKTAVTATAASVIAYFKARWLLVAALLSSARVSMYVQALTMPFKAAMDTIGHEHIHVLQVHDENKTGINMIEMTQCNDLIDTYPRPFLKPLYFLDKILSLGVVGYLRNDAEIQARMHTVLAKGYREKWQQLPVTRHQLWGALISLGLNAPAAIRGELDCSADPGLSRFYQKGVKGAFNRAAMKCTSSDVADLNTAHASLFSKQLKEKYWLEILPFLYGHLVELYGDPQGRRRMGIVPEERPTLEDVFNRVVGRVVNADEVEKRAAQIETSELTRREKLMAMLIEQPLSIMCILAKAIFGKKGSQAHVYSANNQSENGQIYFDEAYVQILLKESDWTITPALTKKLNDIVVRAVAEVTDYRQDVRTGKLKPVGK